MPERISLPHHHHLPDGPRVTLRLVRPLDADGILRLLQRAGRSPAQLELKRLVKFDPCRRLVVCAVALIDHSEQVVGVGEIDLGGAEEPTLLVVDSELAGGLEALMREALVGHATVIRHSRAA